MHARRLTTALAAAAVVLSPALVVAGPAGAGSTAERTSERTSRARVPASCARRRPDDPRRAAGRAAGADRGRDVVACHLADVGPALPSPAVRLLGIEVQPHRRLHVHDRAARLRHRHPGLRGGLEDLPRREADPAEEGVRAGPRRRRPVGQGQRRPRKIGKEYVVARAPAHVVPAGVASQTVDYRLKTKKITKGPRKARRSVASKPVTVTFDNQAMYTGDQARFYAPIAHCAPTPTSTSTPPTSPATAAASSAGSTASPSTPPTWPPASTSPRSPSWARRSTSAPT